MLIFISEDMALKGHCQLWYENVLPIVTSNTKDNYIWKNLEEK